jgi:hypothetical protein
MMDDWHSTREALPPEGVTVETMIKDVWGEHNVAPLKRNGRLWFMPDGSMYVYYSPTHWRETRSQQGDGEER